MQLITLVTAIIGAVCGILGAILGIINTIHQLNRNRIRLKIIPNYAIPVGGIEHLEVNFGIEVINLSEFPVAISDIGFLLHDGRKAPLATVGCFEQPSKLPIKLEPRTSYQNYFDIDSIGFSKQVEYAYVATQCGELIKGTSVALKQKIKDASI